MSLQMKAFGRVVSLAGRSRARVVGISQQTPALLRCYVSSGQHDDAYAQGGGQSVFDRGGGRQGGFDRGGGGRYDGEDRRGGEGRSAGGGGRFDDNRGGGRFDDNRGGAPMVGGMPDRMGSVGQNLRQLNWEEESLVSVKKDFYVEHEDIAAMDEAAVAASLKELNATIAGRAPHPKPLRSFEHLRLPAELLAPVTSAGFPGPTAIQSIGWPAALSGRDMVGIAQTGSGKTLAYLLPALVHIAAQPPLRPGDGPLCLVVAPTRELAMQIQTEAMKFTQSSGIRCAACFGGVSRYGQAADLKRGVEILIATPGRLLDFIESGVTNLKRVTFLILDEADRMLDMGFEPQIRKVLSQMRPDRQTLLYSATWPKEIQRLARDFCREDPVKLTIGSEELTTNADIVQQIEVVGEYEKRDRFMQFIKGVMQNGDQRVLVFTATKRGADSLTRELQYQQLSAAAIHGDKEQRERDRAISEFKSGRVSILVATDVAQRGLDIKDCGYVVNYDLPKNIEDYIHRIGRTGRAGAKGTAVSFFPADAYTPDMIRMARSISKSMREVGQTPPDALLELTGNRR